MREPVVDVVVGRSRCLLGGVLLAHAGAAWCVLSVTLPIPASAAALGAIGLSLLYLLRDGSAGIGPRRLSRLRRLGDGSFDITLGDGRQRTALQLVGAFCHPLLVGLELRDAGGARSRVLIARDSADADRLRALRVSLRARTASTAPSSTGASSV